MPLRPSVIACQASRQLFPSGQTVPMPVTTTRRFDGDSGRLATGAWRDADPGVADCRRTFDGRTGENQVAPLRFVEDVDQLSVAIEAPADVREHMSRAHLEKCGRPRFAHFEEC